MEQLVQVAGALHLRCLSTPFPSPEHLSCSRTGTWLYFLQAFQVYHFTWLKSHNPNTSISQYLPSLVTG